MKPVLFAGIFSMVCQIACGQSPVTITLDSTKVSEYSVPVDFIGLSFETEKMLPDARGGYFFSATNKPLITLLNTLGVKSLRIGGNTADRPTVKVPVEADADSLFAFAKAANVRVIYTLRLREGNLDDAVHMAKYITSHYKSDVACLAVGNEPNVFAKEYPVYRDEWRKYADAITAADVAPNAKFCGPSATPGKASWARDFINDFGRSGKLAFVTQHDYPGGAGNKATNVVAARDRMLSPEWLKGYDKFYSSFATAALSNGLPYRIEEANNFYNGGAKDVSDTFAAALWGLDYLHWWAAHRSAGINFHTGDQVAAGEKMNPCRYATFWTSPEGYNVHPLGYGIKAFELGSHGKVLPCKIENPAQLNLTVYAVSGNDPNSYLTLINKEHGEHGRAATVTINAGAPISRASLVLLGSPNSDLAALSGTTLGGGQIDNGGHWNGKWAPVEKSSNGKFSVTVPAVAATVIRFESK